MRGSEVTLNWTHVGMCFVAYWVGLLGREQEVATD